MDKFKKYLWIIFPSFCTYAAGKWYSMGIISLGVSLAMFGMIIGTAICMYQIGKMER